MVEFLLESDYSWAVIGCSEFVFLTCFDLNELPTGPNIYFPMDLAVSGSNILNHYLDLSI